MRVRMCVYVCERECMHLCPNPLSVSTRVRIYVCVYEPRIDGGNGDMHLKAWDEERVRASLLLPSACHYHACPFFTLSISTSPFSLPLARSLALRFFFFTFPPTLLFSGRGGFYSEISEEGRKEGKKRMICFCSKDTPRRKVDRGRELFRKDEEEEEILV